jgi:uncharacterized protein
MFVKAPRPGTVKTRLGLGEIAECEAYRRLVRAVVREVAVFDAAQVRFTPDDAEPEIRHWVRVGWAAAPQGEGDLGARMQTAFAESFAAGVTRVVIIGSDCPYLTAVDIRQAWEALKTSDLVVGPAKDGGYWLIGLRENQPGLFTNMAWSSKDVFCKTMARAKAMRLKTFLLRTLSDVDTRDDWQKFISAEAQRQIPRQERLGD